MDHDNTQSFSDSCGVYTKTVVSSPVIKWILPARIRHRHCKDVVFVGEHILHVKQLQAKGHLKHIATKNNFDARIRAARTFNTDDDVEIEDFLVKLEKDRNKEFVSDFPPQLLVLTLESDWLVFLYLDIDEYGAVRFVQQACPIPSFDQVVFQPGEHLAVDPASRAVAIAASEREVIIYSTKPKTQLQNEMRNKSTDWSPIAAQRPLRVDGVIHHFDFLNPPDDHQDRVILLLIVTDQLRVKALVIDWLHASGPLRADFRIAQPIGTEREIPTTLIPLRGAAFLLVTENRITRWKGILSGALTGFELSVPHEAPRFPGTSSYPPLWVNWAKPLRSQTSRRDKDIIYLVREDGVVYQYTVNVYNDAHTSQAGELNCHIGTAFASLGDAGDPDILAAGGETSSGSVVSIGLWPSTRRLEELTRDETMTFVPEQVLTNWASVTDMISGQRVHSSRSKSHSNGHVLVTSGRQPFGCITELRIGLEARLASFVNADWVRTVRDVWVLPESASGSVLLVMSMPFGTRMISITADLADSADVTEGSAFDTTEPTLAAAITSTCQLVQITRQGVCLSDTVRANFEDTIKATVAKDTTIIAAAIPSPLDILCTAERSADGFRFCCYSLSNLRDGTTIDPRIELPLSREPLALAAIALDELFVSLIATDDGQVAIVSCNSITAALQTFELQLPPAEDTPVACDHLSILQARNGNDSPPALLAVCGLRDGKIVTFGLGIDGPDRTNGMHTIDFGQTTVKLSWLELRKNATIAMSGPSTCLLTWNGGSPQSVVMEDIWVSDKERPEYAQSAVVAVSQMPDTAYLASEDMAESLVIVSGDSLLFAKLEDATGTVPRQMRVSGTPNRLLYSEFLRCLICVSRCVDIRTMPSSRPYFAAEETRQIWPTIDFIPYKRTSPSFSYKMQPGERVNTMIDWCFRQDDKTYVLLLVGGSYVGHTGRRRGRMTFLQPVSRNWEVVDVNENKRETFEDEVYAIALYDEITYIACAGEIVHFFRFDSLEVKWNELCPPFKLASPGIHVTVERNHHDERVVSISTMRDSLVTLSLVEKSFYGGASPSSFELQPVTMGPRAESLLSHFVLEKGSALYKRGNIEQFTLLTTKFGQLLGLAGRRNASNTSRPQPSQLVFEAQLPRSLTRLVCLTAPKRKGSPPLGLQAEEYITASATDGSLVRILLFTLSVLRRLFWLQRLIEWSKPLSPHLYQTPPYSTASHAETLVGHKRGSRILPIGLEGSEANSVVLQTNLPVLQDLHLDGDILSRVLHRDGKQAIKQVMEFLALKGDCPVGRWIREHFDAELERLDELIEMVRRIDGWV